MADRDKILPARDGRDDQRQQMAAAGAMWARLPQTLIVCVTPTATSAGIGAAASAPLVGRRDAPPPPSAMGVSVDSSCLRHLQQQQSAAALELTVRWLSPETFTTLLSALVSEWSVLLYCRDASKLSSVCCALRAALVPLGWQGARRYAAHVPPSHARCAPCVVGVCRVCSSSLPTPRRRVFAAATTHADRRPAAAETPRRGAHVTVVQRPCNGRVAVT